MQIHHTIYTIKLVLQVHPVSDGTKIIAYMDFTGGLNARQYTFPVHDLFVGMIYDRYDFQATKL
jgi:hypothetical protein